MKDERERRERRLGRLILTMEEEGYTADEIENLLHLTTNERVDIRHAYWTTTAYRRWWHDERQIDTAIIEFAKDNDRWPIARDFRIRNGLPSPNTVRWRGGWITVWDQSETVTIYTRQGRKTVPPLWMRIAARARELPPALVLTIPNLTARREAITAFGGPERLIKKGGAYLAQQDDYGKLWQLQTFDDNGRWARYVEVVNSTQKLDSDGKPVFRAGKPVFDHYFLRVPPDVWTAKDAVAWTGWFEGTPGQMITGRQIRESMGTLSEFEGFLSQS